MKPTSFIENLIQDLKYALRMLRRSPGFTATAIAALALGIGANAAIFTVVNTVLLQPLPYPHPERLVRLERSFPTGKGNSTSIPKFLIWSDQPKVFESVAAYDFAGPGINLTGGDRPEQVKGIHASAGYFGVFGATMALGRPYSPDEDRPGGPHVVVISNGLWHSHFGQAPNIIGRSIQLGGDLYEVIGVLSPSFVTDPPAELLIPLEADPNSVDQGHYLLAAARLRPGIGVEQAKAAMKVAAEEFRRKYSNNLMDPKETATAEPLRDAIVGDVRPALLILFGAVAFVLLIACANVANLLLARATLRRREIAIRAALGAGRRRIIYQLLTESILLSLGGGALGLVLGYWGVRALLAMNPGNIPRIGENGAGVTLDWRVAAFTFGVSLLTGILFGLIPAFQASRADLSVTLKESGSRAGTGIRHNRARSILVVTEMALALVLLVGAALLIRTFVALRSVKPGFDAHSVLTMRMSLAGAHFEKTADVALLTREAERRVEAVPAVTAVAATCCLPLEDGIDLPFVIVAHPPTDGPFSGDTQWRDVTPHYFDVFRIPLRRGRIFTEQDVAGSQPVVVINEAMAKQFWPKEDPVGQIIAVGGKVLGPEFEEPPREIVGIVGNVRETGLDNDPPPIMYVPLAQTTDGITALGNRVLPIAWAVRTTVAPFSLNEEIQTQLRLASGGLPVAHVLSMEQVNKESTARGDFNMTLLTIFAGVALMLAAIGIYGLMAYSVQQRTQEIGIRMALGASPERVRRMVVFQGMRLALMGVVIGVGAAMGLTRLIASMLYGVKTWDPFVLVSVTVLLSGVALFSAFIPALRASRVDPLIALHYE
jgi:putative ABC transport system permease protein